MCHRMVEAGEVTVNGQRVLSPALNVGPKDMVRVKVGRSSRVAVVVVASLRFSGILRTGGGRGGG